MDKSQIKTLLEHGVYPCECSTPKLIETHISWVILCNQYVFKIKKPLHLSFLDFSSFQKRKEQCLTEVLLNSRLARGIYIDVVGIGESNGVWTIMDINNKEVVECAVRMNKMNPDKRMDLLLDDGQVRIEDVVAIADILIEFHRSIEVVKGDSLKMKKKRFNDLGNKIWVGNILGIDGVSVIDESIKLSDEFLDANAGLLALRQKEGFVRNCHGDLHSRNIFLLEKPIIFDCIEFNDEYRSIDILNELAFFCMDLEAHGADNLSEAFFKHYNGRFKVCRNPDEEYLFVYFKAYRANVRAKVNVLRAEGAMDDLQKEKSVVEANKYLQLMETYLNQLPHHVIK